MSSSGGSISAFIGSKWATITAVAAIAAGAVLVPVVTGGSGGGGTANVWVNASAGASPQRCSSACPYDSTKAYGSLDAAFSAASTNDLICVRPGDYAGDQSITASGAKSGVTVEGLGPDCGVSDRPTIGQLQVSEPSITVRGLGVQGRDRDFDGPCGQPTNAILFPCGADGTYIDVDVDGLGSNALQGVRGAGDGWTFRDGAVHGIRDLKGMEIGPANALIENNHFYDILQVDLEHEECIYYDSGSGTTIRGNRFDGCPIMSIFFTQYVGGPPYSDITLENNVFTPTTNPQGLHNGCTVIFGGNANREFLRWKVRNNTFVSCTIAEETPSATDDGTAIFTGNLGGEVDCGTPEWTHSYNVSGPTACSGTGQVSVTTAVNTTTFPDQAPFYVDAPGGDYRLKAGANAAVGAGNPLDFPTTDLDGNARTSPPDAGAYER